VARREILGVVEADIVIVLLPGGRGTHAELGAALALAKPVALHTNDSGIFVGPETCAFYHHPCVISMCSGPLDMPHVMSEWLAGQCDVCGAPATCLGSAENGPACDTCCGHGEGCTPTFGEHQRRQR
jgi:hypothetical protein